MGRLPRRSCPASSVEHATTAAIATNDAAADTTAAASVSAVAVQELLHTLLEVHRAAIESGRARRLNHLQEAACKLTDGRILSNA